MHVCGEEQRLGIAGGKSAGLIFLMPLRIFIFCSGSLHTRCRPSCCGWVGLGGLCHHGAGL